jgi:hypothetical protein
VLAVAIYFLTKKKEEPTKREAVIKKPLPLANPTVNIPRIINPNLVK